MKKINCLLVFIICFLTLFGGCTKKEYKLDEKTFFLVMSNMLYYPQEYLNKNIEYDCFVYELEDINGKSYTCGVRKCSAEYGCKCGQDTIIGFVLNYGGEIPKAKNQSEDTNDKTWIHLSGKLDSAVKTEIVVHSYNQDGTINYDVNETISLYQFNVESLSEIDGSNLQYYVTK